MHFVTRFLEKPEYIMDNNNGYDSNYIHNCDEIIVYPEHHDYPDDMNEHNQEPEIEPHTEYECLVVLLERDMKHLTQRYIIDFVLNELQVSPENEAEERQKIIDNTSKYFN